MGGRKGRMGKGKMGSRISGEGLVGEAALGRPDPAALSPPLRGRGRYPLAPFFPPHPPPAPAPEEFPPWGGETPAHPRPPSDPPLRRRRFRPAVTPPSDGGIIR
jgi:hypothetical protein